MLSFIGVVLVTASPHSNRTITKTAIYRGRLGCGHGSQGYLCWQAYPLEHLMASGVLVLLLLYQTKRQCLEGSHLNNHPNTNKQKPQTLRLKKSFSLIISSDSPNSTGPMLERLTLSSVLVSFPFSQVQQNSLDPGTVFFWQVGSYQLMPHWRDSCKEEVTWVINIQLSYVFKRLQVCCI